MSLLKSIKSLLAPAWSSLRERYLIISVAKKQGRALKLLHGKKVIKCVFMAIDVSVWKYDDVVRLMMKDPRFDPVILVCPMVSQGVQVMKEKMRQCLSFYQSRGFNVICAYNEVEEKYVDLIKDLSPDILFYTNPYEGLIDDRYFITNYLDVLSVYVSYYLTNAKDVNFSTNLLLYNIVWRKYVEFKFNLDVCKKFAINKGRNAVVTGYPGIDPLIDKHIVNDPFKGDRRKRIIWAPHHTLETGKFGHSCFLQYAEFMLEMVEKYKSDAIFIFKPHPHLKGKLINLWGKERAEDYYVRWNNANNAFINEGDYVDLFLSSDAMIHDSGSFVVEYLYVNKPVLRTVNDVPLEDQFNDFALSCLNYHYMAYDKKDIETFIRCVINNEDPLQEKRTQFVNEVLMPEGSPSKLILEDILYSIDNQILYHN